MRELKDSNYYLARLDKLIDEKVAKATAEGIDKDLDDWDFAEEYSLKSHLVTLSCYLEISEARLEALKIAVQDSEFTERKKYLVKYLMPAYLYFNKYKTGDLVEERLTKQELLAELEKVNLENFGDDIEEWECWLQAWKNDRPNIGYR
jgi:hypothetical protein